jgi:hypothetical protein
MLDPEQGLPITYGYLGLSKIGNKNSIIYEMSKIYTKTGIVYSICEESIEDGRIILHKRQTRRLCVCLCGNGYLIPILENILSNIRKNTGFINGLWFFIPLVLK